jgi:hypothetical protein
MSLIIYEKVSDGIAEQLKWMMKPLIVEDTQSLSYLKDYPDPLMGGLLWFLWQLIGMTFWIFMLFGNCLE